MLRASVIAEDARADRPRNLMCDGRPLAGGEARIAKSIHIKLREALSDEVEDQPDDDPEAAPDARA
jgi:hypothetical protein